jgi:hypothetical protein
MLQPNLRKLDINLAILKPDWVGLEGHFGGSQAFPISQAILKTVIGAGQKTIFDRTGIDWNTQMGAGIVETTDLGSCSTQDERDPFQLNVQNTVFRNFGQGGHESPIGIVQFSIAGSG